MVSFWKWAHYPWHGLIRVVFFHTMPPDAPIKLPERIAEKWVLRGEQLRPPFGGAPN